MTSIIVNLDTWYKYYPIRFNDGVAGMSNDMIAVYQLVLNRIAICDNQLKDDDKRIASLIRQPLRLYRRVKRELIEAGKLYIDDGLLRNPKADEVLGERRVRMAQKSEEGRERANRRWNGEAAKAGHTSFRPVDMSDTSSVKSAFSRDIDENRVRPQAPNLLQINKTVMQNAQSRWKLELDDDNGYQTDEERNHAARVKEQLARMKANLDAGLPANHGLKPLSEIDENRVVSLGDKPLKNNETAMQNQNKILESYPLETPKESLLERESVISNECAKSDPELLECDMDLHDSDNTDSCANARVAEEGAYAPLDSERGNGIHSESKFLTSDSSSNIVYDAVRIVREIMDNCDIDEARCFWHSTRIQEWLLRGIPERTIKYVIEDVIKNVRKSNPSFVPQSLRYFDRAMDAVRTRIAS